MAALPIDALREWDFEMTPAPGASKAEDKLSFFFSAPPVNGKPVRTTPPSFVMGKTRVAFGVRPGVMNEKAPEKMGPNTMLNMDIDVPESAADAMRKFDDRVCKMMEKKVKENKELGSFVWHGLIHEPRTGSGYDPTASYRVQGWSDFVARVHGRALTYKGETKTVPGSVDWLPRDAKSQPLREKEAAFYRYGRMQPNGEHTYRQQVGGHLASPDAFPSGTMVRVVFTVTHVLLTLKYRGTSSAEAHASVILAAKEVYEQPRLAAASAASGIPLMPGVVFDEEDGDEAGAGGFVSETTLAQSPASKRFKRGDE